jgi:lysophospholipase L1-like esterase
VTREPSATDAASGAGAPARVTRALLLATGVLLLVAAVAYNEWTLAWVGGGGFRRLAIERIRTTQVLFACGGALLVVASELVRRVRPLRALAERRAAPVCLLVLLSVVGPPLLLDLALQPFIEPKTELFVRDPELGWRLRPNTSSEWGHVRIEVNAKGLRGPEVGYARTSGALRILYLGDSVTIGFGIERVADTYPYLVADRLTRALGTRVETVNSAVEGWSPWQELAYLRREGLRYQPDLIVVGFVLNDVTEKFSLARFGGSDEGFQLARSARSRLDAWLSHSAIASFAREGIAQFRFGRDVFIGATRYDAAEVQWLAANARSDRLAQAWRLTFADLAGIFDTAAEYGARAALLVFPYSFQLEDPDGTRAPQAMLAEFAEARGVPQLDLLPALLAAARAAPDAAGRPDVRGLYLDPCHLSVRGLTAVADAIAEFLERQLATPQSASMR